MDLLDRLYFRLRDALSDARHGGDPGGPTVADVYQRLVPYRAVRGDLGILELAEYEHALMRLLAGERGYAAIGSEEARAELERELASPNPILGVYRDYSALPVRVRPAANGAGREPAAPASPAAPPEVTPPGAAVDRRPAGADGRGVGADRPEPGPPAASEGPRESACARCGARLRAEWRFCTRCGAPRPGVAPRA